MNWCANLVAGEGYLKVPFSKVPDHLVKLEKRVKYGSGLCLDGKVRWFSQYRQDAFLWERHSQFLGRRGIYLDVATNDPFTISNTYFMEKCLGWRGICVEPQENYLKKILPMRSCHVVATCFSDTQETVKFRPDGGFGGVDDTNKNVDRAYQKNLKFHELQCTTLERILDETNVNVINYLSLDVEVLQGIDWKKVTINIMTVETHLGPRWINI